MSEHDQVIRANISETEEYLVEAARRSPGRIRNQWITCGVAVGAGISTCLVIGLIDFTRHDKLWWIVIPIGVVVVAFAIYQYSPAGARRQIRKEARKRSGPAAHTSFEFRPEGFTAVESRGKTSFFPWTAIQKVAMHDDGFVIYFGERTYSWLPQNAFVNDADFLVLQQRILSKVQRVERVVK